MAQVYGALRDDKATHGEKIVLKLLSENLPKEFSVYVECPIHDHRQLRYPDFIVSTNYGVIVLEVKDWIQVIQADRYHVRIRTRGNKEREEGNPVNKARDYALVLTNELRRVAKEYRDQDLKDIPWGYAVVLPNLPTSTITQLRRAWGDEFVLNRDDLVPGRITNRIESTLPVDKIRSLKKTELDLIRATINPTVFIEQPDKPAVILDEEQEKIVSEPVKVTVAPSVHQPTDVEVQLDLLPYSESQPPEDKAPTRKEKRFDPGKDISQNIAIRLVRGVAGSGKTLVLIQRARYLAAQYPEWDIVVLTFNNALKRHLESVFRGTSIKAMTFHGLCKRLLGGSIHWAPQNARDWLDEHSNDFPIVRELSPRFIEEEFKWIKDIGLANRKSYFKIERRGRGGQGRLGRRQRELVYDVLLAYQAHLRDNQAFDWGDIPYLVMNCVTQEQIRPTSYQAVLIDEAQDFAPIWFRVVEQVLDPDGGLLFLVDDPSQSIYRFFSWRQKGVHVVGRTRHLRIPYRNTYEIYNAAYSMIQDDEELKRALSAEGQLITPNLDEKIMRHGRKPLLQRFESMNDETTYIRECIKRLQQRGYAGQQIAVLHRRKSGAMKLGVALKGLFVHVDTFHASKGLEFEIVFLSQLQETFTRTGWSEDLSQERRLAFMAMTRARQELFMNYEGKLPAPWKQVIGQVDRIH